jgi:hypothetical protein
MRIITNHPNAIIGGLIGAGGIGQAVLWLLTAEGIQLSERQSGLVVAASATVVLAAGRAIKYAYRNGVVGVWHVVLHGKAGPGPAASATETGPVRETVAPLDDEERSRLEQKIADLENALEQRATQLAAAGLPVPPIAPVA